MNRTPASPADRVHIEALDGLRGIAAISVLLHHGWVGNSHGWLAVDLFYCLSGFVLALAYERQLAAGLGLGRYMTWRVLRIYPMLFVGGVLGLALWRSGEDAAALRATSTVGFALAYAAHLLLIPYVGGGKAYPFNNSQWSIFYELVANAVHALVLPILTQRTLGTIVAASGVFLALRAVQLGTMNVGFDIRHVDVALARTAFSFFLGVLLFRLRHRLIAHIPALSFWWLAIVWLALGSLHSLDQASVWLEPSRQLVTVMIVDPALILLALGCPTRGPLIRWLGILSFPLYAIHAPLLFYAQSQLAPLFDGVTLKAAMVAASAPIVLLSLLLGYGVDLPLNRRRRRLVE